MDNLNNIDEAPEMDNPQEETQDNLIKRYKEQLNWSKSEAERLRRIAVEAEIERTKLNPANLLDLYKKDPKLAKEVWDKFDLSEYWGFESYVKNNWKAENSQIGSLSEDEFERLYQSRRAKEEHQRALKKVDGIFSSLETDEQERAKSYFDKITSWKTLDEETATEFAEMATLYVTKDKIKSNNYYDAVKNYSSTWMNNKKKPRWDEKVPVVVNWKLVYLNSNE